MSFVKVLLCLLLLVPSQERFERVGVIKGGYSEIHADSMGSLYVITKEQNLCKLSSEGDTLYTFEDKGFLVSHVDPSNPMKLLVYDNSQNTVRFLDKTLTPINSTIRLDDLNIPTSNVVSSSRDNLFWVFDDNVQELKKYNRNLQEVANSGSLTSIIGNSIQPISMPESEAKVYVLESLQGVFQFDHLGTYLFNFKKIQAKKIIAMGSKIVFLKNKELYLYDTVLLDEQKIELNDSISVLDFAISKNNIFIMTEQNVQIFRTFRK